MELSRLTLPLSTGMTAPHLSPVGIAPERGGALAAPSMPCDSAALTRAARPLSDEVFGAGRSVTVMRSSGQRDSAWHVEGVRPDGQVTVRRDNMTKAYPALRLLQENPSLLPAGLQLAVRRSSGQREEGWAIEGLRDDGRFLMRRGDLVRPASVEDLVRENPTLLPQAPAVSQTPTAPPSPPLARPAMAPRQEAPVDAPATVPGATPVSHRDALNILTRAVFEPNPLGIRPKQAADLSPEFLSTHGLEPRHTLQIGDRTVHVSAPWSHGGQRTAFVGYVEEPDGRVRVRTFYQSNSQGTWRSASHCGASGWIGKGWGEESTNLPISAQKQLGALVGSTTPTPLEGKDADTAFYGNLPVGGHAPPPSFTDQVNMATFGRFDETMPPNDHGKPETFHYDAPGNAPDFSRREDAFTAHHPSRGNLSARVFRSADGEFRWLFYQDERGRAWVGAVEKADSKVNTYGVNTEARHVGSLSAPAVEYGQQIPADYVGAHEDGPYYDGSAYTHAMPPVAAFLAHQRRA